jgi:RHS repeat-associated protein
VVTTSCPWRWPGQYDDEDTGLYHNYFRYYDPEAGRYVSQDPIGLSGGLNLYQYVEDPLLEFDPFGWAKCDKRPWIKRSVFQELQRDAGLAAKNKFIAALENGIVGPYGKSGIKMLDPVVDGIYTHELKIGGSAARVLGYMTKDGYFLFDKFLPHGLH